VTSPLAGRHPIACSPALRERDRPLARPGESCLILIVAEPNATRTAKSERYRLQQPLGEGGQGRTYRATDSETGRAVAVKVIQLGAGGWKPFDLFERECQALRSLSHPAIPRYLDTFALEEEGRYFLVMELVEGTTLRRMLLDKQRLTEAQLYNFLHQALGILDYLHGCHPPVIHRDIKPANLILRDDGALVLVDFGGVRLALRPEGGSTVVGTFGYMAPEQLHGEATPATDIYGLGATLAALASGMEADKLPRQGLRADLAAVISPSPLRDLLQRMLEPDPTRRPASTAAVRALLGAGPAPAGDGPRTEDAVDPELGVRGAPGLVIRILGSMGYVGFVLLDAMILPLVLFIFSAAWSNKHPRRLARLRERTEGIRGALRGGRSAMKALAAGRDPRRRPLPPPSLPPVAPPRALPRRGRRR